ncbi:MAG TPA: hypothetical protein VI588_00170 [Candidatus Gracilibacteria bacterium]|nr:hypothetical protein [Candidatus Gracilibacteria bacterium]
MSLHSPGGHPSSSRIKKIKDARKKAQTELPADVVSHVAGEHEVKREKAAEQYPFGRNLEVDANRALVRKRVSELMFSEDVLLASEDRDEITNRQINRYYDGEIGNPVLRGHIEAVHGTEPSQAIVDLCKELKLSSHEEGTLDITKACKNWLAVKQPRVVTDVNQLPKNLPASLRSEGSIFTREYNLNAVKAQRDLTARVLEREDNLDSNGKAKNPYLAVYVHGKVDTRGHDFEIAAAAKIGDKGPIDPRVAFWIAERLREKIGARGMKNINGETPAVNVVASNGSYSGSPALTRLRSGDAVLGFKGFGDNFQALQLECGRYVRDNHANDISTMLDEVLAEFSDEFKTAEDFTKHDQYRSAYQEKIVREKAELFARGKILFAGKSEDRILLGKSLREELEVEVDEKVRVAGREMTVGQMSLADLKTGKTMGLHPSMEALIGDTLTVEKI